MINEHYTEAKTNKNPGKMDTEAVLYPALESGNYSELSNHSELPYYSNVNYSLPNLNGSDTGSKGSNRTQSESSYYESEWHGLAKNLWIYASPFIFVIGCIGNILILIIMSRPKFKGTSTGVYLWAMALADLFVLIIGMVPEWLSSTEILIFKEIHPWTCKTEKFLQYSVGDTAIWILVAFTCDRFLAVCFPFNKNEVCKPSRARIYCLCLVLTSFVKNFHLFWTRGAEYVPGEEPGTSLLDSNCGKPDPYRHFEKFIRPWIAFTLISALPFCIILFCNIMIIKALVTARKLHKGQKIQTNQEKTYFQMTMMCLSASFAFLIFITPSIVLLIGKPYWKNDNSDGYIIAKAVNNQFTYVNHSINFFLYCISGKRFRIELLRLFGQGPPPGQSIFSTAYATTDSADSKLTIYRANTPILDKNGKKGRNSNSTCSDDAATPIISRSGKIQITNKLLDIKNHKNKQNDKLLKNGRDLIHDNNKNRHYTLIKVENESSI